MQGNKIIDVEWGTDDEDNYTDEELLAAMDDIVSGGFDAALRIVRDRDPDHSARIGGWDRIAECGSARPQSEIFKVGTEYLVRHDDADEMLIYTADNIDDAIWIASDYFSHYYDSMDASVVERHDEHIHAQTEHEYFIEKLNSDKHEAAEVLVR